MGPILVAILLSLFGKTLLFYSHPYLYFILYGLPSITSILFIQSLYYKEETNQSNKDVEWFTFVGITIFYMILNIFTTSNFFKKYNK